MKMHLLIASLFLSFVFISNAEATNRSPLEVCSRMPTTGQKAVCYTQVSGEMTEVGYLWDCRLLPNDTLRVTCFEKAIAAKNSVRKNGVTRLQQEVLNQFVELCGGLPSGIRGDCVENAFAKSYLPREYIEFSYSVYTSCKGLHRDDSKFACFRDGIVSGFANMSYDEWSRRLVHHFKSDCDNRSTPDAVACYATSIGGSVNSSRSIYRAYECAVSNASLDERMSCINVNLALASEGN